MDWIRCDYHLSFPDINYMNRESNTLKTVFCPKKDCIFQEKMDVCRGSVCHKLEPRLEMLSHPGKSLMILLRNVERMGKMRKTTFQEEVIENPHSSSYKKKDGGQVHFIRI